MVRLSSAALNRRTTSSNSFMAPLLRQRALWRHAQGAEPMTHLEGLADAARHGVVFPAVLEAVPEGHGIVRRLLEGRRGQDLALDILRRAPKPHGFAGTLRVADQPIRLGLRDLQVRRGGDAAVAVRREIRLFEQLEEAIEVDHGSLLG